MAAYLTTHRPVRDQWYDRRNRPLTGCTVLHTSESVMDDVGPDTGTDALAAFIRGRTTAGSYHDIADSDSNLHLIEYVHGAYHDGTGSNNWALSISFVCRTTDWDRMTPERRRGFLRQGALAFKRQQDYRRSVGAPLTELRLISKAQSDRGESGLIYHGHRDPGRRTDPGVAAPNDFPIDEFITECLAVMAGEEDDMFTQDDRYALDWLVDAVNGTAYRHDAKRDSLLARNQIHYRDTAGTLVANVAGLRGQIDGLTKALQALAAAPGQSVDLSAVHEAARLGSLKGVEEGIEGIDVTVRPARADAVGSPAEA